MISILEGQPPKTRPFSIKTRVIWVPGIYKFTHLVPRVWANPQTNQSSMFQQLYKSHLSHEKKTRPDTKSMSHTRCFIDGILRSWFMNVYEIVPT